MHRIAHKKNLKSRLVCKMQDGSLEHDLEGHVGKMPARLTNLQ